MQSANAANSVRRSSRVPVTLPIVVTSLEPAAPFSELCETLVVSAHGCVLSSPSKLDAGVPVQFQRKGGRATMAHVVDCQPMPGRQGWQLGARLDRPENFWGLKSCPEDWARLLDMPATEQQIARMVPPRNRDDRGQGSNQAGTSLKLVPDKADHDLRALLEEAMQPLQAEIAELKDKLAKTSPKRSQFEISLSHIPPEVEEKLWVRLHEDLGTRVLQQTQEQSKQVFGEARTAIEQKIAEAMKGFRSQVGEQLQTVEQRAHGISEEIAETVAQHLQTGAERFQAQAAEAGTRLERQGHESLQALRERLGDDHDAYRREVQKVQAAVASESSRLQGQISSLGGRIGQLDEIAIRLESDMETRLTQMANDQISGARVQLEHAVDVVLKELGSRNAKELGHQLDEACGKLKVVQKGIEASVSELVKTEVAAALLSFGQTMEVLAQDSVGRWRGALAHDLTAVAKTLGQQFQLETLPGNRDKQESAAD
ncbi:MAG TPA: hypothetical protein VHS34_09845 [Terriglobales bacterium]|nr:hypothetical protein [Terriglobales bacterium]